MKSALSIAVLLCTVVLAGPAQAEQLPLEDFVKHGDYLELTISPDGQHLLARRG